MHYLQLSHDKGDSGSNVVGFVGVDLLATENDDAFPDISYPRSVLHAYLDK